MKVTCNLSGLRLDELADALGGRLERGVHEACEHVKEAALQNLKGDPRARHLIQAVNTEVEADLGALRVTGKVGVGGATDIDGEAGENFGIYVHEGTGIHSRSGMGRKEVPWFYLDAWGEGHTTSGMQANPFLENAYNSEAGHVAQIIAKAIGGGG